MAFDVDFFVIGAGSGGVRAARIAAGHGARTVVAEESRIGGTCVIRGCVPKKLYVYASRFADDFADAAGFGWRVGETTFDWPSLVAAKEKEITRLSAAYRANLAASGAELIEERATIIGPQRVRLASGQEFSARHILVSVGSRPTFAPERRGAGTRDHVERNLRPAGFSAAAAGGRRRLHRCRIRLAFPAAGVAGDPGHACAERAARLRRRHARGRARSDGPRRRRPSIRLPAHAGREAA